MDRTTVILDAFGGDNAPLEPLKGSALAVREYGVSMVLCGDSKALAALAAQHGVSLDGIEFADAAKVIPVEAPPTEITKEYADSSMALGLQLLAKGRGHAFVTAGSTGAAVVGASLIVKRIKGVKRPAIGTVIPAVGGCYMLMDAGANAECRPEMLQQFAIMGSAYMEQVMGVPEPRVALVNIGAEETKGLALQREAYALLGASPVRFTGNAEARELPLGGCDVAVCDGFVGNVILKLTEGMGKMMAGELKDMLLKSPKTKMGALLIKDGVDAFRKKMDYTEYGGAPLMGIAAPVIKAHGSSNAHAFKNAIRQAKEIREQRVIPRIEEALARLNETGAAKAE